MLNSYQPRVARCVSNFVMSSAWRSVRPMIHDRAGDFPASEALADTTLSLPMHPHLDGQEILRTVETVASVLAQANEPLAVQRRNASPAVGSASSDA